MRRPAPAPARSRTGASRPRRMAGVSLLEMVIVILLVAVMSLLAASAMSGGLKGVQLRSAAKEIAARLRYTRTRAIATAQPQRFVIDPAAHTWQAPDGRHGALPDTLRIAFTGARETQPAAGQGAIVFFPDGASTGGRVSLSRDGAAWNVDVAWLTGEVTLARAEPAR